MSVPASALYGSLLAVITVLLATNVSRNRGRAKAFFGDGGDKGLESAIRAHGHAAEYVPLGVLMLVIAEILGANATSMHGLGGTMLVGRLASSHGILARVSGTRVLGAMLTWLAILGTVAYVLLLRFK